MAQHVRIYGLPRDFDPERFAELVLALAEHLAAEDSAIEALRTDPAEESGDE